MTDDGEVEKKIIDESKASTFKSDKVSLSDSLKEL